MVFKPTPVIMLKNELTSLVVLFVLFSQLNASSSRIKRKSPQSSDTDFPANFTRRVSARKAKNSPTASQFEISPSGINELTLNSPPNTLGDVGDQDLPFSFSELFDESPLPIQPSFVCIEDAIRAASLESVSHFIFTQGVDVNALTASSTTPFALALEEKNEQVVEFIISTGKVDPNVILPDGRNYLVMALELMGAQVVESLLTSAVPVQFKIADRILLELQEASSPHFMTLLNLFMKIGTTNLVHSVFMCSLHAAKTNGMNLIRFLHSKNFPLRSLMPLDLNQEFTGLLHSAAAGGHTDMLAFLLEIGCEVNELTSSNAPPIVFASEYGHFDAVCLLIQHGATIAVPEIISKAIFSGRTEIVRAFAVKFKSVFLKCNFRNGFNPVTYAIHMDKPEILDILLENDIRVAPDSKGRTIYNMEIPDSASDELNGIISLHRLISSL